jgi:hypothetical protein
MEKSDDPWQHRSFVYLAACGVPPIVILAIRLQDGGLASWTTAVVVAIALAGGAVVAWLWLRLFGTTPTVDALETPQDKPGSAP